MSVITRFAPSPTGYLHIGGARTALFNYLFAKRNHGKFFLRIEDTDKARSTKEATNAIFEGLKWLGLDFDEPVVFQSARSQLHQDAALKLLEEGKAYYCFATQQEIETQKEEAIKNKQSFIFNSPWRDVGRDASKASYPKDQKPVVRLKAPRSGVTIIPDVLQGNVEVANDHLDDMVLLRSDGTPTYMLAVVVDDHDMGITHIIRGDDHLTNAARQIILYQALGFKVPVMVHIPLIHGQDGAKLSKRHGALGIESYKDMGFLPEALCNYLLRLGWGHGDDEVISKDQAIKWFDLDGLGKAPARLDMDKMKHINGVYLRAMDNHKLTKIAVELLKKRGEENRVTENVFKAMDSIKSRAQTTVELMNLARLYLPKLHIVYNEELQEVINNCDKEIIELTQRTLENMSDFTKENIQIQLKEQAVKKGIKIGAFMEPIRILLTGMANSPSIFELISIIGKSETIRRLSYYKIC